MKNLNMTNGMKVGMSFSKVRGALCRFTVVSFLALSLAALVGLAGAQTRDLKQLSGSSGLASGAEHAQDPERAHSNYIANDLLYRFCNNSTIGTCLGFQPVAGVILDNGSVTAGTLYGTDMGDWGPPCTGAGVTGGANPLMCDPPYVPRGQVYMYNTGTHVETVLHQFNIFNGDGWNPVAALIQDSTGNLYGTTYGGGAAPTGYDNCMPTGGCGTVFELSPPFGTIGSYKVLYNFEGGPQDNTMDGANPAGALIQDGFGNLYGTTESGGLNNAGTVFALCNPNASGASSSCPIGAGSGPWTEKVIYNFGAPATDGRNPLAGLFVDPNGNMWGTTAGGGNYNSSCQSPAGDSTCGTIFELQAGSVWTYVSAYSFCPGNSCTDGANPAAGVTMDTPYLFGTAEWGGANNEGTVFAFDFNFLSMAGSYSFCPHAGCDDGANPLGGVIVNSGTVYGTTAAGGKGGANYGCAYLIETSFSGCGTAFSLPTTLTGSPTTLYNFCKGINCTDGMSPAAGLTPNGSDYTHLYGTTQFGGLDTQGGNIQPPQSYYSGQGTVFELYPCSLICLLVNPGNMTWGNVQVGAIGVAQIVNVINSGTQAAQITSIEISGEFAFTKVKGGCVSGTTLKPGATCEIGATFDPTQTGYQTGQITIMEKADGATQTVALSGTGVE